MVKLHLAATGPSLRGAWRPRKIRVAFGAARLRIIREARWHLQGLLLAVLASLVIWGMIAKLAL